MLHVFCDEPPTETGFSEKFTKPRADSHSCRASLLDSLISFFGVPFTPFHTEGYKNNFQCFLGGRKKALFLIFFNSFLTQHDAAGSTKGRQTAPYQPGFAEKPSGSEGFEVCRANRRWPETAAILRGRWLFCLIVWLLAMKMKSSSNWVEARVALLGLWWGGGSRNRQEAADNSTENTAKPFFSCCLCIHQTPRCATSDF